jgi:hypothetical protein
MYYQDEKDCILDYPDITTILKRFKKQNVVPENKVIEAIENTNIFLEFDDIEFDKKIKLPSIYPDKSQDEKDKIYKDLINKK